MAGRVDGTAAVVEDRGIVFLFNPNPDRQQARFKLDASIGLAKGERFMIKELYPEEGRLVGSPEGLWSPGSDVVLSLPGREAAVYEIFPAPAEIEDPVLFDVRGAVSLSSGRLALTDVVGEMGTARPFLVLVPAKARVRAVSVNGVVHPFKSENGLVKATVRFAGRAFGRSQSAGEVPPGYAGVVFRAKITVPARVFTQLSDRKKAWPVKYTEDDLRAPWLGPWRLLLHIPIFEATDAMDVSLKVNGQPVQVLKAYNSVYPHSPERTFLGHYADLSRLRPDTPHTLEVTLPTLEPGRFRGLFFENVEPEYTKRIMAPPAPAAKTPAPKK